MFDSEHFPEIQQEYPKSAQDFFQNSQDSIYNRVVHWIKRKKPEKLIIEGLELLQSPNWAYLLKQSIKRNSNAVSKAILEKSSKNIRENEASKILILQTAYFFQETFDPSVIKLLAQQEIALKEELQGEIQNPYTWGKMKNDGSIFSYDEIGFSISHQAAARGNKNFFEWLASKENETIFEKAVKITSNGGLQNPFHIAAYAGSDNIIEWAISISNQFPWIKEAIQSTINLKGEQVLFIAAKMGRLNIFKRIYELGFDPINLKLIKNKKDFSIIEISLYKSTGAILKQMEQKYKRYLLHDPQVLAWKNGNPSFIIEINSWFQNPPDQKFSLLGKYGNFLQHSSILHASAYYDNLDLLKEIIGKQINKFETKSFGKLTQIFDDYVYNSLYQAAKAGHYHVVEQLISQKLYLKHWKVNEANEKKTPLEISREQGHRDIEQLLQHSIASTSILENNMADQLNWKEIKKIPSYLERIGCFGSLLDCSIKTKNQRLVEKILRKKVRNLNIQDNVGKTPLFYSIEHLDQEIFKLLIANGASPFIMDNKNLTPIHLLIKYGLLNLLGQIYDKYGPFFGIVPGINPVLQALQCKEIQIAINLCKYLPGSLKNQKDILFQAVEKNYSQFLELLIKQGISGNKLDLLNMQFESPLFLALRKGNEESAHVLLDNGASISIQSLKKDTALSLAIQGNCSSKIIEKILQIEEKSKFPCIDRTNLLAQAIRENKQQSFDLLLKQKAVIELECTLDVGHPVFEAVFEENEYFLSTLLKNYPNIFKMLSEKKRNLLSLLAESKRHVKRKLKILEPQITFDWFRDQLDNVGQPPLFQSVKYNNFALVCWLFENGASFIHFPQFLNENLLTQAIINENFEIVELLLKKNFDVNDQNAKGETALIKAILQNNPKMVKFLLEKSPDIEINKPNFEEETPFLIAIKNKNFEIIKTLLSNKKINLNIVGKKSNYPLLCLPFDDLESTLAILRLLYPFKKKMNCFVSSNSENLLIKALKAGPGDQNDEKKNKIFKKIISIILKLGFSKNLGYGALNQKDKDDQTAFDIAYNNKFLFRIAKLLMFAGCNGKKAQLACRKRLLFVIYNMYARMINIPQLRRKEKRFDILDEIFI